MNKRAPYNDYKHKTKKISNSGIGDLLLNLKIIPNKSKEWNFYAKSMNEYLADHQELISQKEIDENKQNRNLDSYGSYLSYMSRETAKIENDMNPKNHIWHYSNLKMYKGEEISTYNTVSNRSRLKLCKFDEVPKIHEKSHIWSIVISEKDLNMKEIMYKNQHQIVDRIIRSMFKFPVNATFAFHGNTEHPHIHIMVYQPSNMENKHIQKKWKINQNNLQQAKKSYYYFLANNKNYFNELLEEKHKLKNMYNGELLVRLLQKQFVNLLKILSADKEPWLDENNNPKFSKNGEQLYKMKFQFNRLNEESKNCVLELKDFILNIDSNNEFLNEFQTQYKKFHGVGDNLIEKEFEKLPDRKKDSLIEELNKYYLEADEKICQQILNTAKEFYLNNSSILKKIDNDFDNNNTKDGSKQNKNLNVIIKPAINKLLMNYFPLGNYNNMNKNLSKQINLNENFSALKKLIKELEREKSKIY